MNKRIDFFELTKIIWKDWRIILVTGIFGLGLSYSVTTYLITPEYQAETQLLVNRPRPSTEEANMNLNDIQSNIQMISTYRDILTDAVVLNQVLSELEEPLTQEDLIEKMNVVIQEDSQIFKIEVVDEKPERAAEIVNLIASTFQKNVSNILHVENVAILSAAKIHPKPISPRFNYNLLLGTAIGLIVGVSISLAKVMLDTKIRDEKVITEKLNWVHLGSISAIPRAAILQAGEEQIPIKIIPKKEKETSRIL